MLLLRFFCFALGRFFIVVHGYVVDDVRPAKYEHEDQRKYVSAFQRYFKPEDLDRDLADVKVVVVEYRTADQNERQIDERSDDVSLEDLQKRQIFHKFFKIFLTFLRTFLGLVKNVK